MLRNRISLIGLRYVVLPLAVGFATRYSVTGFDINPLRINSLKAGVGIWVDKVKPLVLKCLFLS